jgi:hypothetical protein
LRSWVGRPASALSDRARTTASLDEAGRGRPAARTPPGRVLRVWSGLWGGAACALVDALVGGCAGGARCCSAERTVRTRRRGQHRRDPRDVLLPLHRERVPVRRVGVGQQLRPRLSGFILDTTDKRSTRRRSPSATSAQPSPPCRAQTARHPRPQKPGARALSVRALLRRAAWTVIVALAHNLLPEPNCSAPRQRTPRSAQRPPPTARAPPVGSQRTPAAGRLHLPARWPWQTDFNEALTRIRALPAA